MWCFHACFIFRDTYHVFCLCPWLWFGCSYCFMLLFVVFFFFFVNDCVPVMAVCRAVYMLLYFFFCIFFPSSLLSVAVPTSAPFHSLSVCIFAFISILILSFCLLCVHIHFFFTTCCWKRNENVSRCRSVCAHDYLTSCLGFFILLSSFSFVSRYLTLSLRQIYIH